MEHKLRCLEGNIKYDVYYIIHITGPSGVGKTTLGMKLKETFNDRIIIKDLDELYHEFIKRYNINLSEKSNDFYKFLKKTFQEHINQFICKFDKSKPIIFIGLNMLLGIDEDIYYDVYPIEKYYIELNDDVITKQKCGRFLDIMIEDKTDLIDAFILRYDETIKNLSDTFLSECNLQNIISLNKKWHDHYRLDNYKFGNSEFIMFQVNQNIDTFYKNIHHKKYLKYKQKYILLKQNQKNYM